MRRLLKGSIYSSMGLVVLLGYQNCTKPPYVKEKPVPSKSALSAEWQDIYSKK